MKVIIAGSRNITLWPFTMKSITRESGFDITEVVSGTARGADQMGEEWARNNNIPISRFPANWESYGKGAGMVRNKEMAYYADALIAIWDGISSGTKNMIDNMKKLNKPIHIHLVGEQYQD
jgi:hypothetical protein